MAGNREQFDAFLHNVVSEGKDSFIYASSVDRIRGYRAITLLEIGTAYERKDYLQLRDQCRRIVMLTLNE